jgi:hypothetical protein
MHSDFQYSVGPTRLYQLGSTPFMRMVAATNPQGPYHELL